MDGKTAFNATVCLIGTFILLVHIVNLLTRRRRKDETTLLVFFALTAFHFTSYAIFTFLKMSYPSDALIMSFYTAFYVMNNLEATLFLAYRFAYSPVKKNQRRLVLIINTTLLLIFIALDFVNLGTHMFFYAENGVYHRSPLMILSQGYQFIAFAAVFFTSIISPRLKATEKLSFATYCVLPLVAIILQNLLPGYAIAYLAIVVAIEVLFVFLSAEKSVDLERKEKENAEVKNRLMMSQIRPHFIYNVLSSVSTLIPVDPPKAQQALDEFTEYLRANFSAATQKKLIPFSDELKHVENYVALEKLRFEKRLYVEYDIKAKAFEVPPLSIQPLVENAIKHGVTQKTQGGIVTLRTYEESNDYVVEVIDDGVGFDMKSLNQRGDSSIGLSNIEFRIDHMCGGTLAIESQEGAGTKATVRIPKR